MVTKIKDRESVTNETTRSSLLLIKSKHQAESQLELLQGVVSSSSSTASSRVEVVVEDKPRPVLVKGESNTKLLHGCLSSSETASSSISDKSQRRNKNSILARAAFLISRREKSTRKMNTPKSKQDVDEAPKRLQPRLPNVEPPEFIYIPSNTHVSLHIVGEPQVIQI